MRPRKILRLTSSIFSSWASSCGESKGASTVDMRVIGTIGLGRARLRENEAPAEPMLNLEGSQKIRNAYASHSSEREGEGARVGCRRYDSMRPSSSQGPEESPLSK